MSDIAIKLENISKQYRLGTVGTNSLKADMQAWWYRMRGIEDKTLKIGQENSLADAGGDYVWALKDINLEVKKGEILGIIGKNGAGKSTLLKLLSRVTGPTTGEIKINGRIASLLEVGTGFHGELTGRENIFLNGSILGMTKNDIRRQLDEIVEFAGIAKYIDTPVKRYSSGMYVRLGFAVAAHMNPDILIVDEVLAVGDAEFQKKAIGKMKEVSQGDGRTVLFVSHNMNSINTLCTKTLFLKNGTVSKIGPTQTIIDDYLISEADVRTSVKWTKENAPGDDLAKLLSVKLIDENGKDIRAIDIDKKIGIQYEYEVFSDKLHFIPNIHVFTNKNEYILVSSPHKKTIPKGVGVYNVIMWIPQKLLNSNTYTFGIALSSNDPTKVHFFEREALFVEAVENIDNRHHDYKGIIPGIIRPELKWDIKK